MSDSKLLQIIQYLPDALKQEVMDFIEFLVQKQQKDSQNPERKIPQFGQGKIKLEMAADFDEPLEDFKDYM